MRFRLMILLVFCLVMHRANAQFHEYTKHISRSFRIGNSMTVEISNKYGRVHIIPWNEDSVRFSIDMRIRAKDGQKLERMKQNVEFEFTTGQYFVVARTRFVDSGSDVFKDIVDIAGSYLSSSNSVSINYTVMVPASLTLKIENKFGDVYFDDHNGPVTLVLSYGNLKANRLNGRSEMKMTSGDAEINYMKDGMIAVGYGNVHIRECGKLSAQTQSSVINIEKLGSLKLNSRRDKYFVDEIGTLSGESYFSNLNLGRLSDAINLTSRYGDITIDDIPRSFSIVNINSELTDLTLSFEKPLLFGFDLTHYQSVTFMYPQLSAHLSTKVIDAEEKIFSTSGNFGSGPADSKVTIKALRKCSITILPR